MGRWDGHDPAKDLEKMVAFYQERASISAIAAKFHCNPKTLKSIFKKHGITLLTRGETHRIRHETKRNAISTAGQRQCTKCKETKPLEEFSTIRKQNYLKWNSMCNPCFAKYNSEWAWKNRKKNTEYVRKRDVRREQKAKAQSCGITIDQYDFTLSRQNSVCAICGGIKDKLYLDHDHYTHAGMSARGFLCSQCNFVLADSKDKITTLWAAIHYLVAFPAQHAMSLFDKCGGNDDEWWWKTSKNKLKQKIQWHRKDKFGVTPARFAFLLNYQRGKCAICKRNNSGKPKKDWCVDHRHINKKAKLEDVRGLLCGFCNPMLGHAKDNPNILRAAIIYLCDPPIPAFLTGREWVHPLDRLHEADDIIQRTTRTTG